MKKETILSKVKSITVWIFKWVFIPLVVFLALVLWWGSSLDTDKREDIPTSKETKLVKLDTFMTDITAPYEMRYKDAKNDIARENIESEAVTAFKDAWGDARYQIESEKCGVLKISKTKEGLVKLILEYRFKKLISIIEDSEISSFVIGLEDGIIFRDTVSVSGIMTKGKITKANNMFTADLFITDIKIVTKNISKKDKKLSDSFNQLITDMNKAK